ncbi:hypothetical protein BHE90_007013 [Fusarium euwallaceae]|uniref:Cation efflux protein transmembrane domain-containing protein n=1 Tax=Fusarium euwallaceae TaxID=1147111 RepID=A0A430LS06_9HYPO|nr:hypothetical protein BHE90_007013 [Fusarium euwallaceae]
MTGQTPDHRRQSSTADSTVRAVRVGVIADVSLTTLKLAGGWAFRSSSLSADGWHSASDLATDLFALVVVVTARGDIIACFLGRPRCVGSTDSMGNITSLQPQFFTASTNPNTPFNVASEHSVNPIGTNFHAVWIALITVIVKEWLYHRTLKVAMDESSTLLKSTAMHHRLDGLMSFVTIATVALSAMGIGEVWMDSLGGLCISLLLTQGALQNLGSVCGGLVK